jgi:hypothetical protein
MESFWSHPKVAALGRDRGDAVCLWTLAHSWVDYQQTDGLVPTDTPSMLTRWSPARVRRATDALVRVVLWEVVDGGWAFHEWAEHNLTRQDRAAFRRGGERGGRSRASDAKRDGHGRYLPSAIADLPVGPVGPDQTESGGESGPESGDGSGGESGVGKGEGMREVSPLRVVPSAHEAATNGHNPPTIEGSQNGVVEWLSRFWGHPPSDPQMDLLEELATRRAAQGGWGWLVDKFEQRPLGRDPIDYAIEVDKRWKQQERTR